MINNNELETIFNIKFKSLPLLPIGLEDFGGGIIDNDLIITCGFGGNFRRQTKPPYWKSYDQRFFYNKTYKLELNNTEQGFKEIINFPGNARQKIGCIVVNNKLYAWGGLSYKPCKKITKQNINSKKTDTTCYRDGYKLSKNNGSYSWSKLPDLPENITGFSITNYNNKIYIFGGCDYYDSSFNTWTDRNAKIEFFGSRLFMIDTQNIEQGWQYIGYAQDENNIKCTPRMNHIGTHVNGNIYILGGGTGRMHGKCFYSTVDNWIYNIEKNSWRRLIDCPSSQTNWRNAIVYKNRYIILVGGVLHNGASTPESKRNRQVIDINKNIISSYGIIRQKHNEIYLDEYHKTYQIPNNGKTKIPIIVKGKIITKELDLNSQMCGDIIVFDTIDEKFFRIDSYDDDKIPLPINNNIPFVEIFGNKLIILGGELDYGIYDNIVFKGCTDMTIIGEII